MAKLKYKRVLLKLSGEALLGKKEFGIEPEVIKNIALEIKEVREMGAEIGIVIGGGNIFRGITGIAHGMDRVSADNMGMLATVINALALQDALENEGIHTRIQTAIEMKELAEPYIRRRAIRHLEKERVVIFAGGTGNPYFTTDTAASLRANEIGADVILKATNVEGVYTSDPTIQKDATKFSSISYIDILKKGLKIMDSTAVSLCMDNNIPIVVFNLNKRGNIKRVLLGEKVGTLVGGSDND